MTIKLSMPDVEAELKPRITVVGVGGAGGNAVNNMIDSNLVGVEFLVCNTDAQALGQSNAERRIQLGVNITQGLGAGARPEVGRAAAEEALEETLDHLSGSNMVFITAGMGGGTGTGAAPVIARATREQGILTVGVVTKPFHFEGMQRMRIAEAGIEELTQFVDTLIIIPNQNLFRVANEKTTFADAFNMADDVLYSGVRGVTDLMVMPGLINLDFADVRTVMSEMGKAMMGTGESDGERRAIDAAEAAISNPLLEDITMEGAKGVLINITGGPDMTLFEVDEAANRIREEVDPDANILFGSTFDESLEGRLRVSVVATGIDAATVTAPQPLPVELPAARQTPAPTVTPEPEAPEIEPTAAAAPAVETPSEPEPVVEPEPQPASETIEPPKPTSLQEDAPETDDTSRREPTLSLKAASSPSTLRPPEPPVRREPSARRSPFIPPKAMTTSNYGDAEDQAAAEEPAGQPVRRRSLFERMTGVSRVREMPPTAQSQPAAQTVATPPSPAPQRETAPTAAPVQTGHVVPPPLMPENPAPQAEPVEVRDETTANPTVEEEVLDIPAFLRRQAN